MDGMMELPRNNAENPWGSWGTELDHPDVIRQVLLFLTKNEILSNRTISINWNSCILESSRFQKQLKGKIGKGWYKAAAGFNLGPLLQWNSFKLRRFQYHRHSSLFKMYWQNACSNLKILEIHECSLECDGLKFLLDNSPVLHTLKLYACKLRDVDDLHIHGKDPPVGAFCSVPKPITKDLVHLSFKSLDRIEQCFMDYIIGRTGNLESLEVTDCFTPPKIYRATIVKTEALLARYLEFERNLSALIDKNSATLRCFSYMGNNHQDHFLANMATREPFNVKTLKLAIDISTMPNITETVIPFLRMFVLEELFFHINGIFTTEVLKNILHPCNKTRIRKLYLGVDGRRVEGRPIDLDCLQSFDNLEDLEICDEKELIYSLAAQLIGGRRTPRPKSESALHDIRNVLISMDSHISPGFLNKLPPKLTKLKLNRFMCSTADLFSPAILTTPAWVSFRKLTKLEIRGPWIHSMKAIVPAICGLTLLESLTMTACGLTDEILMGLDETVLMDCRCRCSSAAELFHGNSFPTPNEIKKLIYMDANPNLQGTRISALPNLQHLDLSLNPGITDISLFDGFLTPKIQTLNLHSCNRISDVGICFLALFAPGIRVLGVKNCHKLTFQGINKIVNECRNLKKVHTTKAATFLPDNNNGVSAVAPINPNYKEIVVAKYDKCPLSGFYFQENVD